MSRLVLCALILAFFNMIVWAAHADDGPVYYVSMRSLLSDPVASFVLVVKAPNAERQTNISGCDGVAYYATSTDAQAISIARAAGETVHLHRGTTGQQPVTMPIKCRFE